MNSRRGAQGGVAAQSPPPSVVEAGHVRRSLAQIRPLGRRQSDPAPHAARGFAIGEISCRAHYAPGASAIEVRRSVTYGLARSWAASALACGAGAGGAAASCPTPPASDLGRPPLIPAPTERNGQETA